MRRDRVNVSLTADGFVAKFPACINHNAKQQHSFLQFINVFYPPNVHSDGINGIRPGTVWIPEAGSNSIQRAILRLGPEHSSSVAEVHRVRQKLNVESGIKAPRNWLWIQKQNASLVA